jgi:hypothetical protein
MKNLPTYEEFVNESEANEGLSGLLMMATLSGLFSVGQWAYKTAKYWLSKPGRYFKKLEKDEEFFKQFVNLLLKENQDPLKALHYFTGDSIRVRKAFIEEFFNLPRAIELRNKIGLNQGDMWRCETDFEEALLGFAVYDFLKTKLSK